MSIKNEANWLVAMLSEELWLVQSQNSKNSKKTWIERCRHLCVCPLIDHRQEPIWMRELLGLLYNILDSIVWQTLSFWFGYHCILRLLLKLITFVQSWIVFNLVTVPRMERWKTMGNVSEAYKRVIVGAVSEVSLTYRHFCNGARSFRYKWIRYKLKSSRDIIEVDSIHVESRFHST